VTHSASELTGLLRSTLERRVIATLVDEAAQRAAVAIVVTAGAEPAVLLVKRQERAGDPWSGHAAFPGGFCAAADRDASATAERETEEETGLSLARVGERLGQLDDVYPRSIHLPKVIVTPCVFAVPGRLPVAPTAEVERALWVPFSQLVASANRRPLVLELPGGQREFDSIHVESLVIWGLTERIFGQLLTIIEP
jgi:8-oxo-dGTP pyrophosphatase MutT (NUDIX family)